MVNHTEQQPFLLYPCDACGTLFCERVNLMNLSLGLTEQGFCLQCLANEYERTPLDMAVFCWQYVQGRDCFLDPWQKVPVASCPQQSLQTCCSNGLDESKA